MERAEGMLRSLLALEGLSPDEFGTAACALVGADHFLLFEPRNEGGQRLVLSTSLPGDGETGLRGAEWETNEVAELSSPPGRLWRADADVLPPSLQRLFPESEWVLGGVGESGSCCGLFLGAGPQPGDWIADPLVSKVLLRRFHDQVGRDGNGARAAAEALARLSHEFKTPLVSIKGYAELILDQQGDRLDPRLRDWVRRIAGGANRLAALYRKATAHARSEVADSYESRPVDPVEWVRRCVTEVSTLAAGRALDWSHRCGEGLPLVRVDPEAAHEMLAELLQNAARATPDGGQVDVTVVTEDRPEARGVRISVRDSGVGVPRGAESLRLFDRFTTLGSLMGHHSGEFEYGAAGLGLGLSMARGVARGHGGDLWVEAQGRDEGRLPGACFHVWLPVYEMQSEGLPAAAGELPAGRVLLVEPDPEQRHILEASLQSHYRVVGAGTPKEALRLWAAEEWQGCVVEPHVPGGGVELIRTLRSQPGREETAILTYSTDAGYSEAAAWRAAGADSCVGKPARSRVLLQRLQTIRERRSRR